MHDDWISGCVVPAIVFGLFIAFIVWAMHNTYAQTMECERRGGHMHAFYKAWECLTSDGRIIEL